MSSADLDGRPIDEPAVASSAGILGTAMVGHGVVVAQGTVVRSHAGQVTIGDGSAVLENSVVVGTPTAAVIIGRRSVFGHRCLVVGATVGDLCEIGNGTVLLPGARLGDRVFTGEGTVVPTGADIPDDAVVVGRPGRVLRRAAEDDLQRLRALRGGDLDLPDPRPARPVGPTLQAGGHMGTLYRYRDRVPQIAPDAVLFDSAEITGDVVVGAGTIVGAGVRIIGDSHGPVRIGARVQILENTVLHLLPDNELVLEDDVVIGPGAMIHGCHLGAGTVVEPGAIVCDHAVLGEGCLVRAGSCVTQRSQHGPRQVLEGFPAKAVATLDAAPDRPGWALDPAGVASLTRVE